MARYQFPNSRHEAMPSPRNHGLSLGGKAGALAIELAVVATAALAFTMHLIR